jgi:hypothetical protein
MSFLPRRVADTAFLRNRFEAAVSGVDGEGAGTPGRENGLIL